jgi:hypothetical protein
MEKKYQILKKKRENVKAAKSTLFIFLCYGTFPSQSFSQAALGDRF